MSGLVRFTLCVALVLLTLMSSLVVEAQARSATTRGYVYYNHTENSWKFTTSQSAGAYFVGPNCGNSDTLTPRNTRLWWDEGGCSGPVVSASYKPSLAETGWDELTVETSARFDDRTQAYAAGYMEGYLTHDRIYALVVAILRNKPQDAAFSDFLTKQDAWLRKQVNKHAPVVAKFGTKAKGTHNQNPSKKASYWYGISLVLAQLDGMLAGYNSRASAGRQITLLDLWSLNDDGDRLDIDRAIAVVNREKAANATASLSVGSKVSKIAQKARFASKMPFVADMSKQEVLELIAFNGHCSALIKLTEDDLLVGHNTWADYDELLRSYKSFSFNFHHPSIRSQAVSFTSYPGFLWSSDDFYITSRGSSLVVTETTITILDENLYKNHVSPEKGVMSWLRNILANRVASSAKEWVDTFKQHNSGTYNNQWMVIDMNKVNAARQLKATEVKAANATVPLTKAEKKALKKSKQGKAIPAFAPNAAFASALGAPKLKLKKKSTRTKQGVKLLQIPKETFYLMEQIPGYVESRDMSKYLKRRGYFAAYNLPFFKKVNEKSRYVSYANALDTESLVYGRAPRGVLFAKLAPNVTNVDDMKRILRWNDYTDKGSVAAGCPAAAIASRYDLSAVTGANCEIKTRRLNGAIDAKITAASLVTKYEGRGEMTLISGPTSSNGISPFDWNAREITSDERNKMRSTLTATRFDFSWQNVKPKRIKALPNKQPVVPAKQAKKQAKKAKKLRNLKKLARTPLVPVIGK